MTVTGPAPAAGSITPPSAAGVAAVRRPARVRISWLLVVIAVLVVVVILSVTIGSRAVTWDEISAALGGSTDGLGAAAVTKRQIGRASCRERV